MSRRRIGDPVAETRDEQVNPASAVASIPDSAEPRRSVTTTDAQRLSAVEATLSALIFSTFSARDSAGKPLVRCRCGLFATRTNRVAHPVAGTQAECLCDSCVPSSPLATKGVPQTDAPLLGPADMTHVVKVNRNLEQARAWGAS